MYIAWHNSLGRDLSGVRLELVMLWMPQNQNPRPVDVLPLYFDVNLPSVGANEFDVPPGRSEKAFEFTVPTEGRILGVSGHLHDYGREVRLEDAASGKVLTRVAAKTRPDGSVKGMERHLFGVSGAGLKLKAVPPLSGGRGLRQPDQRDADEGRDGKPGGDLRAEGRGRLAPARTERQPAPARSAFPGAPGDQVDGDQQEGCRGEGHDRGATA